MLRPDDFRRIALRMHDAIEGAHMGHPDFRTKGKIFATLYPDGQRGMVILTPEQQEEFVRAHPATFVPASGAWGRQGCTTVQLDSVDDETLGEAMTLAWQNAVTTVQARGANRRTPPGARRGRSSEGTTKRRSTRPRRRR